MSPNGNAQDADCGIALAFGRNSIPDKNLALVRDIRENERSDFATIKKLATGTFKAGAPNKAIGDKARLCILLHDLPMIVQWEVAVVLFQKYPDWVEHWIVTKKLFCLWPQPEQNSYRAHEVLEDALRIIIQHRWHSSLLLAHDLHMPRVYMLARKFGLNPIVGFTRITDSFDPNSVKPMTSHDWRWILTYEPWVRIHHLLHGWV